MKVLAYFDLFNYPVTAEEIRFFLDREIPESDLQAGLEALVAERTLFSIEGFFALRDEPEMVERRLRGNKHADELLTIAGKGSRLLFQFPFVRAVGISGSLSKHYADEHADIDYFIITLSNRLWIARTFMHLYKKLSYLTGHQHWYCMNYYVDEEALEIEEKNIFTATELITLLPACGNGSLTKFFDANDWVTSFLPYYRDRQRHATANTRPGILKKIIEWFFDNRIGDWLDDYLRRLTTHRWQKKEQQGRLTDKGLRMSLKNGKHYSRPNPEMMQKKILTGFRRKLQDLEQLRPAPSPHN